MEWEGAEQWEASVTCSDVFQVVAICRGYIFSCCAIASLLISSSNRSHGFLERKLQVLLFHYVDTDKNNEDQREIIVSFPESAPSL